MFSRNWLLPWPLLSTVAKVDRLLLPKFLGLRLCEKNSVHIHWRCDLRKRNYSTIISVSMLQCISMSIFIFGALCCARGFDHSNPSFVFLVWFISFPFTTGVFHAWLLVGFPSDLRPLRSLDSLSPLLIFWNFCLTISSLLVPWGLQSCRPYQYRLDYCCISLLFSFSL